MFTVEADLKIYGADALRKEYGPRLRALDGKKLAIREEGELTRDRLNDLLRRGCNLGMRLFDGLMIVDKDGPNQGPFGELESPMRTISSRGTHDFFQVEGEHSNRIKIGGLDVDCLFHGTVCCAPSIHPKTGWRYTWKSGVVPMDKLPLFPVELLKEFEKPAPRPVAVELPPDVRLDRVRSYIRCIVAESGKGGDRATYRATCRVVEAVQGNFAAAMREMLAWNSTNAIPPWTEKEIEWKVRSSIKAVFG